MTFVTIYCRRFDKQSDSRLALKTKKMTKQQELLSMTHQELMNATQEIKNLRNDAYHLDFSNKVELGVKLGFKHIQIGDCGCIKVRKNENGIFYATRNGRGMGKDKNQYVNLKECIDHLKNYGWGNNVTYK